MPTLNHKVFPRYLAYNSGRSTSYASALTLGVSDTGYWDVEVKNGYIGFIYNSANVGKEYQVHHQSLRFDLRKYKGAKIVYADFNISKYTTLITSGGDSSIIELRSRTRTYPNWYFAAEDLMTPAEMDNGILLATHSALPNDGGTVTVTDLSFDNNVEIIPGGLIPTFNDYLVNYLNSVIEGTGMADMMLVLRNHRTKTIPAGTNEQKVNLRGNEFLAASGTGPFLNLTVDTDTTYAPLNVAFGNYDLAQTYVLSTSWSAVLNGTGAGVVTNNDYAFMVMRLNNTYYRGAQLIMRFDLSGVDTSKPISRAFITLPMSSNAQKYGTQDAPWHVRRYDWTSQPSAAHYRTQAQLNALPLVASFNATDRINAVYSADGTNAPWNVWDYYIEPGQVLIDIAREKKAGTGFVIHSSRMITGVAPPDDTNFEEIDYCASGFQDMANSAPQFVVIYGDGDIFLGTVF